jgi:hypothetical protein
MPSTLQTERNAALLYVEEAKGYMKLQETASTQMKANGDEQLTGLQQEVQNLRAELVSRTSNGDSAFQLLSTQLQASEDRSKQLRQERLEAVGTAQTLQTTVDRLTVECEALIKARELAISQHASQAHEWETLTARLRGERAAEREKTSSQGRELSRLTAECAAQCRQKEALAAELFSQNLQWEGRISELQQRIAAQGKLSMEHQTIIHNLRKTWEAMDKKRVPESSDTSGRHEEGTGRDIAAGHSVCPLQH